MSRNFPSRDELSAMTLEHVRSQVPYDMEDEMLMQEVVDSKVRVLHKQSTVYRDDVQSQMDALGGRLTPEKEAEFQKIIDEREEKHRASIVGEEVVLEEKIEKMEEEKEKIESELKEQSVTAPKTIIVDKDSTINVTEIIPTEEETGDVKCELCGSKGFRHKKGCPTLSNE